MEYFMVVKLCVVGRPGSGKTTAVRHIIELASSKHWSYKRIKDYDMLYSMFLVDKAHKKFRPAAHGGFDVIDFSVLDTALEKLEKLVVEEERTSSAKNELIIIEFARNDYCEALKHFSSSFLKDSYFLFVDADMETCIRRIHERITCPTRKDNHFVSEHIIRSYYNKDNWQYMTNHLKRDYRLKKQRIKAIKNVGSLEEFLRRVDQFVGIFFESNARIFSKFWWQNILEKRNPPPDIILRIKLAPWYQLLYQEVTRIG